MVGLWFLIDHNRYLGSCSADRARVCRWALLTSTKIQRTGAVSKTLRAHAGCGPGVSQITVSEDHRVPIICRGPGG